MSPPTAPDAFTQEAGAYVLGALSAEDTAAFEAHLATCAPCRAAVETLALLPPLLDAVPADLVSSLERGAGFSVAATGSEESHLDQEPPPVLLAGLLRLAHREDELRRRRRALAGLAVAAVLALAVAVSGSWLPLPWLAPGPSPSVAAEAIEMAQVGQEAVTASVSLDGVRWGTKINLSCRYAGADGRDYDRGGRTYSLVVHGAAGVTEEVATWGAVPGADVTVPASTAIRREDIVLVEVRSGDGTTILTADTPAS